MRVLGWLGKQSQLGVVNGVWMGVVKDIQVGVTKVEIVYTIMWIVCIDV